MTWTLHAQPWQDAIPDAVDVSLLDPPFDQRTHASGARARSNGKLAFDPIDPASFVPQLLEITRRWVVCFCALEQLGAYQAAAGDAWIRAGVWVKSDPAPQLTGERPGQGAEGIAIMHRKGRKQWNGGGHAAVWYHPTVRRDPDYGLHPTQKPVGLMLDLVRAFTEPGGLVLDPFAGSGSTGVACLRAGRRFVGCEIDPAMAEVARARLDAESRGMTYRAARAGQSSIFDLDGV